MPASAAGRACTATRAIDGEQALARRRVIRGLQAFVDAGAARWQSNAAGQTELHLNCGEVFLLLDTVITRLR